MVWKTGDHVDTVTLKADGNPWRTWSSKTLWQAGDWSVTVTDEEGSRAVALDEAGCIANVRKGGQSAARGRLHGGAQCVHRR